MKNVESKVEFWLIVFLLTFIPLAVSPLFHDSFNLIRVSLFRFGIAFMLFSFLVFEKRLEIKISKGFDLIVIVFLLWTFVCFCFAVNKDLAFWGLYKFYTWGFSTLAGCALLYFFVSKKEFSQEYSRMTDGNF